MNRVCWCFTSKGMCTVGQDEIVIVLECLPDEKVVPRDIFCHLNSVYEEAGKGKTGGNKFTLSACVCRTPFTIHPAHSIF